MSFQKKYQESLDIKDKSTKRAKSELGYEKDKLTCDL